MKGKAFSLLMIATLLIGTFVIGTAYGWGYTPGDDTKFFILLPNGSIFMNTSTDAGGTGHPAPGELFNITVFINNTEAMSAFGITIMWNSVFTEHTGRRWMAPTMKALYDASLWSSASLAGWSNDTVPMIVPKVGSFRGYGQTALDPGGYLTGGPYDLVILEFKCMAYGPSGFYIWKTNPGYGYEELYKALGWPASGWMNATTETGQSEPYDVIWVPTYENRANAILWQHPPAPYPPEIVNKQVSPTFPMVCDTVTITWDCKPGFNGTHILPVTNTWIQLNLPSGAILTPAVTKTPDSPSPKWMHAETSFHVNESGLWHIKIWCIAPGSLPYDTGEDICQSFTAIEKAATGIDLYQVRHSMWPGDPAGLSGVGPKVPSRPYDPQTLVVLEAAVIYNNDPVQCKIVSFEVRFECEECIVYRTCLSDEFGIARIEFRIPEVCYDYGGPTALFGKWCSIATVEMCEVKYNDTMWFDVGYILNTSIMFSCNTTLVWPGTPGEDECAEGVNCMRSDFFKKCDYVCFNVTITNIDWLTVPAVVILVVYDDNEVPIGQCVVETTVPGGAFCIPGTKTLCIALHIPKYAYCGSCVGYINCFTALPMECGLAYCQEVSDDFILLASA